MTVTLLWGNAACLAVLMTALWLYSVWRRDASVVDPWWPVAFLVVTLHTAARSGWTVAKVWVASGVALWAVRLWLHLLLRARGKPEDPRYQAFRARFGPQRYWWVSLFQVFWLQGALALAISAPLQLAAASATTMSPTRWLGLALSAAGTLVEAVADAQLQAFRRDPQLRGQVMDRGLWRHSRHPNYVGDAITWWGFGLMAVDLPWGWAALAGPACMTWLLRRVSGVPLLDAHLKQTRSGYAAYCERTPPFLPWPWRRRGR
jgi:steroid 5-alpha reductase family enzyme